jgi:multidrug resistance efflux pump
VIEQAPFQGLWRTSDSSAESDALRATAALERAVVGNRRMTTKAPVSGIVEDS